MARSKHAKLLKRRWLICSGLLFLLVTCWLFIYVGSAWWQAWQLKKLLLTADQTAIEKQIPARLLESSKAQPLDHQQHLKGPGQHYLEHVWPHVTKHQDLYKLLILQADANRKQSTHGHFTDFPNTFRLSWGNHEHKMWFEWERLSWHTWHLSQLCVYNPQPLATENNCESSKR